MVKKHKKSSKKKYKKKYNKSSMKDILVRGGEISSSIGVVMAWIVGIIFILIGIFMIVIGIDPDIVSTNNGICMTARTTGPNMWCGSINDKDLCQESLCNWQETKTHGSFQAAYICGGIALIMFSVGMIVFSYWWNRKVHADSNMAAFAGGMAAMNVLSSGMNRGYY